VTSLGGDADATIAVIRSGNWADYFTDNVELTSAAPLSYTFRSLTDGSIAKVTETTEFNITECTPMVATPGTFGFLPVQEDGLPISTPVKTLVGDVNGDGMADMIWNHTGPSGNEIYIGFANGDGTFSSSTPVTHPEQAPEGWGLYKTLVGDVNGDHMTDLIWNYTGGENRTYIGLSNGDGTFTFPPDILHYYSSWSLYDTFIGDVNGDGNDDIIWNVTESGYLNRTYIGLSDGGTSFVVTTSKQDHAGTGWGPYDTFIADITGDGADDIIWNTTITTHNRTYTGINFSNGLFQLPSFQDHNSGDWSNLRTNLGDVNGDGMVDLVWDYTSWNNDNHIYVGLSDGSGHYAQLPVQVNSHAKDNAFESTLADINGDGRADLIWNDRTTSNLTIVGVGSSNGTFDFSRVEQVHPEVTDWQQFTMFMADVDGDNQDDIIWNHPAATNRIYVGLAR
ncbi:MAG: VCBS repeat-containing protein, partial [Calditrichaeota bacterium]